jgi:hypothetical protein
MQRWQTRTVQADEVIDASRLILYPLDQHTPHLYQFFTRNHGMYRIWSCSTGWAATV